MRKIAKLTMYHAREDENDVNLFILDQKSLYSKEHTHNFFEFMIIVKGKLLQTLGGEEKILTENDVCILRPEAMHAVKKYDDHPLVFYNFEVKIEYLQELCFALGLGPADEIFSAPVTYTRYPSNAIDYMKIITIPLVLNNLVHSEIQQVSLKIIITQILIDLVVNPPRPRLYKQDNALISSMLALMEDKENFPLSIREICEKTFYTQEHITRLFHNEGLDSPNRIHLQNKMRYAASLLLSSNTPITEIAEQCGIETLSYFTKAFKREYGLPPAAYRKLYRVNA